MFNDIAKVGKKTFLMFYHGFSIQDLASQGIGMLVIWRPEIEIFLGSGYHIIPCVYPKVTPYNSSGSSLILGVQHRK